MNRFLFGALAMGAVFVLTSFAFHSRPVTTGGPAWRVSDYQLDRAFRTRLPEPPGSIGAVGTITAPVPATGGFIITQVAISNGFVSVDINGVTETFSVPSSTIELNPPIIARPGDVVTLTYQFAPTIAGYTTLPGET